MLQVDNVNIRCEKKIITPKSLKETISASEDMLEFIQRSRDTITNILKGVDPRLIVIVGPCSVHNPKEALDYAENLANLNKEVSDTLFLVMRVYFEKPRTSIGWKGLVNDPFLNGSFCIEEGLTMARQLMHDITQVGLPIATEALDPIVPQYLHDYVSWTAIGARTTGSQTHREISSGLSSPVGFKNSIDGDLSTAVHAMKSASSSHSFLGVNLDGEVATVETTGNDAVHIVLRGGHVPNHDSISVAECEETLRAADFTPSIIIDCSHGNSQKNHKRQPLVAENVVSQIMEGNTSIKGLMLESNIKEGNQPVSSLNKLTNGLSVTDECIDWRTTETLLQECHKKLKYIIENRGVLSLESA